MHRYQAHLLRRAHGLTVRLAVARLWRYTCPDTGKNFFLDQRVMRIRSPWTGAILAVRGEIASIQDTGSGSGLLWKYTCPDTQGNFYLTERTHTIRSPWNGKTFTAVPERDTLADWVRELRQTHDPDASEGLG